MTDGFVIKNGHVFEKNIPYTKEVDDLIYLLSCAVNETKPDIERVGEMDLNAIYCLATFHAVLSLTAFALEEVIKLSEKFDQAKKKAIRKLALFDIERKQLYGQLDKERIWHVSLKGITLIDYYPKFGMREMSDNDVLCDDSRMEDIKRIMEDLGYTCNEFGESNHDEYSKSFIPFEIHKALFREDDSKILTDYYKNIKNKLISCDSDTYELRFRLEDLYIYLLAHEYKHYTHSGIGIRALLDLYVFLKRNQSNMDWNYIFREIEEVSLTGFETMNRKLSQMLFSGKTLNDEEKQLLMYFVSSGVNGNQENSWKNQFSKSIAGDDSKAKKREYLLDRIFLRGEKLKRRYPFFYSHMLLRPCLYAYRLFMAVFVKPKEVWMEYKRVKRFKYEEQYKNVR